VSAELGAVILRCLEKEPAKRYQGAGDLRAALEAVRAGTAATWATWRYRLARRRWLPAAAAVVTAAALLVGLNVGGVQTLLTGGAGAEGRAFKLAVLPFENLTGDPEQEYLSDGMTQELIFELGRLHPARMSVIGRSSVTRYKKSESPIDQIGRELGVGYILEGTCRKEGVGSGSRWSSSRSGIRRSSGPRPTSATWPGSWPFRATSPGRSRGRWRSSSCRARRRGWPRSAPSTVRPMRRISGLLTIARL